MTARDRIVIVLVAVAVMLAALWLEVVSPERKEAGQLAAQVSQAQSQLSAAEGQAADALTARRQYASAYAAIVNLGKAVPASQEVPALIDQLTEASSEKDVEFQSISGGAGASHAASAPAATPAPASSGTAAPAASAASASASASFTELPFSITFAGSYFDLEHLFDKLTSFATLDSAGNIEVSGRLLTIQSVSLSGGGSSGPSSSAAASQQLTGAVTATAYMLPASQAAPAGASPASPASSPAASSASSSSATSPAVIKVNP
ncbi:MAG TPA: type 4a pilus biogenesis protein PilO [Solirubrobacteraceae bacterium]|jgi:Tfp pilus assembly protein PilO|nr:type 4a pilus biogenesis protein PilO [Solirubrobacteraceae bacterium]